MEKENITNFFNPRTVALIGASDHQEKVGGILAKKIIRSRCRLIPINPKHEEIFGIKCYKNILDYSKKIDLAIIAVPSLFVIGALNECGRKGIKSVIVISAGFSEIGNSKAEKEILEVAKKYSIRVLGPNCFGVFSFEKKLDTTFSASMPKIGNIAFLSQSGALWSYISDLTAESKIGFSRFVSLGNMADLGFEDFIEYLCKDRKTKSIILYVEKIKDGKRFISLCKNCKKNIYAVKAGSSAIGSQAAISHTASLASDYEIYKGAFKQAGVVLCESLLEALEKASGKEIIKREIRRVKMAKKTLIITNAGGAGALLSDYLSAKGFELAEKPIDILGTASGSDYFNALEKIKIRSDVNSIFVVLTPQSMSEIKKTAEVIVNFKQQNSSKDIAAIFLGKKSMKEAEKLFGAEGINYFNTLEEARLGVYF